MSIQTIEFTLEVLAPPGWFFSLTPLAGAVVQGNPAIFQVNAWSEGGYLGSIALDILGLPVGVVASITPAIITQDGSAVVTIPTGQIAKGSRLTLQLQAISTP